MSRSLFDPTGDEMLDEGSSFTMHSAQSISHMHMTPLSNAVGAREHEQQHEEHDVRVPLIGVLGSESLGPAETEALVHAAQEALFKPLVEAPSSSQVR
jgi:hypothetical protein